MSPAGLAACVTVPVEDSLLAWSGETGRPGGLCRADCGVFGFPPSGLSGRRPAAPLAVPCADDGRSGPTRSWSCSTATTGGVASSCSDGGASASATAAVASGVAGSSAGRAGLSTASLIGGSGAASSGGGGGGGAAWVAPLLKCVGEAEMGPLSSMGW